jgi:purine-nucleoside phosphorylase
MFFLSLSVNRKQDMTGFVGRYPGVRVAFQFGGYDALAKIKG